MAADSRVQADGHQGGAIVFMEIIERVFKRKVKGIRVWEARIGGITKIIADQRVGDNQMLFFNIREIISITVRIIEKPADFPQQWPSMFTASTGIPPFWPLAG